MATATSDMPRIQVPSNLPDLVRNAFNKARTSGDLTYYPTQVTVLQVNSVPFQLRFSPSLASKPKPAAPSSPSSSSDQKPPKPFNPFANPSRALLISPLPPAHNLVLNKFAVVPEHFILSTSSFAPQTHLLAADDLAATYACVEAYAARGRELFAFFNSGEHSGASQPHRHVQLLDVGMMREGLEDGGGWKVLAEGLVGGGGGKVPFWTAAERIGPGMSGVELREVYLGLYRRGVEAVFGNGGGEMQEDGEARISYNLAMTNGVMVLCPRMREGGPVRGEDGKEVGWLALNGTVLAGTALVKNQAEWDALRSDPGQLEAVLREIGVPVGESVKLA